MTLNFDLEAFDLDLDAGADMISHCCCKLLVASFLETMLIKLTKPKERKFYIENDLKLGYESFEIK